LSSGSIPKEEIELYPNPSGDYIHFSGIADPVSFSIYNSNGRELHSGLSSEGKIDVRNLPTGMYYLHAQGSRHIISEKFIKL